ncbi:carbohydrate sulfotransferase 1-like [Anneissia japonica]|uniref:carbohydrate sulfotransferase 1-like n=1 Tax=Anneissia japonica TaxID=1529436 RepID=UPI001425596D|nr:carbohydrate sulfotransferase 1-like [Anneissia japonica]
MLSNMKRLAGLLVLLIGSILFILLMYTNVDLIPQEITKNPKRLYSNRNTFSTSRKNVASGEEFKKVLSSAFARQSKAVKVMLVGRMRTGSTFIGEILNQNRNLFYLFEPLHWIDVQKRKGLLNEWTSFKAETLKLLHDLSKCVFPSSFIHGTAMWPLARSKSKDVSPICKQSSACKKAEPDSFSKACAKVGGNIAMKFIRSDIEVLRSLVEEEHTNVKIIHLVRDPRGTANSRRSYYGKKALRLNGSLPTLGKMGLLIENNPRRMNTIPQLCQWMRNTLSYAIKRPKWLEGRYKILRYEDFSVNPLEMTEKIYKFIGLPLPTNVKEWLVSNTNSQISKKPTLFSTSRNSSYTATSWRSSLSLEEVLHVQHLCSDVMAELGYVKIYNEADLINSSVPLLTSFEFGNFIL